MNFANEKQFGMFIPIKKANSEVAQYKSSQLKFLEKHSVLKSELKRSTCQEDETEEWQTKVMASMLPDEIILFKNETQIRKYEGAIIIADATGFTDLSDLYQKKGKSGASMLSAVLNRFLGAMVQEVLSQGGDVLKFSGDALMVMFKTGPSVSMQDAVHKAIDTSIIIQKNYGQFDTDIGVVLRIKISISAGNLSFKVIGTHIYSHYIIAGAPIWDCKSIELVAQPGEILVSKSAWRHVPSSEYIFEQPSPLQDTLSYYKVLGFSDSWRYIKRHHDEQLEKLAELEAFHGSIIDQIDSNENNSQEALFQTDLLQEDLFLRPSMNMTKEKAIKTFLIRFMIPTLRQSILANELMDHLNEMRQVVIVFVNLVSDMQDSVKIVEVCDSAFKKIQTITEFYEGTLNKVSLFDKDMMFLIIFGLRGMKVIFIRIFLCIFFIQFGNPYFKWSGTLYLIINKRFLSQIIMFRFFKHFYCKTAPAIKKKTEPLDLSFIINFFFFIITQYSAQRSIANCSQVWIGNTANA